MQLYSMFSPNGEFRNPVAWGTLRTMFEQLGECWIVLDGFEQLWLAPPDEAYLKNTLGKNMQDIFDFKTANIHLIITSRPDPAVERTLREVRSLKALSIEAADLDDDLRAYARSRIRNGNVQWPPWDQDEIEKRLMEASDGT